MALRLRALPCHPPLLSGSLPISPTLLSPTHLLQRVRYSQSVSFCQLSSRIPRWPQRADPAGPPPFVAAICSVATTLLFMATMLTGFGAKMNSASNLRSTLFRQGTLTGKMRSLNTVSSLSQLAPLTTPSSDTGNADPRFSQHFAPPSVPHQVASTSSPQPAVRVLVRS